MNPHTLLADLYAAGELPEEWYAMLDADPELKADAESLARTYEVLRSLRRVEFGASYSAGLASLQKEGVHLYGQDSRVLQLPLALVG